MAAAAAAPPRRRASAGEHTAIGALAGVVEVTIMQPTVAVKNALQAGRPIPWAPKELYRGYTVNAASFAPITAIQFGANRAYETALTAAGVAPGAASTLAAAAAAGATSTLVGNPAELLMIRQQQHKTGLMEEARNVVARCGVKGLYRGMSMALARESLYAGCYLGACPLLRARLDAALSGPDAPASTTSLVVAGGAAGLLAAVLTQPFDTVKTRMQAYMVGGDSKSKYASARATAAAIADAGGGVGALWAGLVPRGVRIVGAVMILQAVRGHLVSVIEGPS